MENLLIKGFCRPYFAELKNSEHQMDELWKTYDSAFAGRDLNELYFAMRCSRDQKTFSIYDDENRIALLDTLLTVFLNVIFIICVVVAVRTQEKSLWARE